MTIGQRIQQIRLGLGLSQEEFGAELGTTRQTVSRWELDQSYPELAKIVLISKLFSVTTDSIIKDGISTFDTETEVLIQSAIRTVLKNRTSFIVAHRLSTIRNASLIIVMRDGKIAEQGRHEELLEQGGLYSEIYNSQFQET